MAQSRLVPRMILAAAAAAILGVMWILLPAQTPGVLGAKDTAGTEQRAPNRSSEETLRGITVAAAHDIERKGVDVDALDGTRSAGTAIVNLRVIDIESYRIVPWVRVEFAARDPQLPDERIGEVDRHDEASWVAVQEKPSDDRGRVRFEVKEKGIYRGKVLQLAGHESTVLVRVSKVPTELDLDLYVYPSEASRRGADHQIQVSIVDGSGAPLDEDAMHRWFDAPSLWSRRRDIGFSGIQAHPANGDYQVGYDYQGHVFVVDLDRADWRGEIQLWSRGVVVARRDRSPGEDIISFTLDPAGPDPGRGRGMIEVSVRAGPGGPIIRRAMVRVEADHRGSGARGRELLDTGDPGGVVRTRPLLPGRYHVLVTDAVYGPKMSFAEVKSGETTALEVALQPAADVVLTFDLPEGLIADELGSVPWIAALDQTPLPADIRRIDPEREDQLSFEAFGLPSDGCWLGFHRNVYRLSLAPGDNGVRRFRVPTTRWVHVRVPVPIVAPEVRLYHSVYLAMESVPDGVRTEYASCAEIGEDDAWIDTWTWAPIGTWRLSLTGEVNRHDIQSSQVISIADAEGTFEVEMPGSGGG